MVAPTRREAVAEYRKLRAGTPRKDATPLPPGQWVPDRERTNCVGCKAEFSFLKRRHHWCVDAADLLSFPMPPLHNLPRGPNATPSPFLSRGCGEVFCDVCSSHYVAQQRMCVHCQRAILHPVEQPNFDDAESSGAEVRQRRETRQRRCAQRKAPFSFNFLTFLSLSSFLPFSVSLFPPPHPHPPS